jgi:hypothetical protein
LHQQIEHLAFVVDGSPQPESSAGDHNCHLVQMPARGWPMTSAAKLLGEQRPELQHPSSFSAPVPAFIEDVAPTRTASIATDKPAAPAPVSPAPVSAPAPSATPEPDPPRRMTASQEASLDAWIVKTYLACWKRAAQPADADPYVARVRLKFKPDGSLLKPPKLVNPPSDPAQKPQAKSVLQALKACDPLPMPAQYRSFYEQWKTETIHFDPQVAAR